MRHAPFVKEKVPPRNVGSLERAAWKKYVPTVDAGTVKLWAHAPSSESRHAKSPPASEPSASAWPRYAPPESLREYAVTATSPGGPLTVNVILWYRTPFHT